MSLQITNNELTNLICDLLEESGDFDYDFDKIESTVESLDTDLRDELQVAVEQGNEVKVREIIEDY